MGQLLADDPGDVGAPIGDRQLPHPQSKKMASVPVGIERVLYAAAVDPLFRTQLLEEREAAVKGRGFKLRESELAMLRLAPAAQLESIIDGLDTSEHSLKRRTFMRAVAASVVTLAAADTISACSDDGIRPDTTSGFDAGGSRPDVGPAMAGIGPDLTAPGRPDGGAEDMEIEIDSSEADRGIRPDGGE